MCSSDLGDARFARRIVGRAVAVPDHVGDDGGAMVGNDDDVEAVAENEMRDLGRWLNMRRHQSSFFVSRTVAAVKAATRPNRDDPATYRAPLRGLRVGGKGVRLRRRILEDLGGLRRSSIARPSGRTARIAAAPASLRDGAEKCCDLSIERRRLFEIDRVAAVGAHPQAGVGKS